LGPLADEVEAGDENGGHRDRDQRSDEAIALLAGEEREHHHHGMDARRAAHDSGVEEVGLQGVNSNNPQQHRQPGAPAL
jgi:hypothetical protein